MVWTPKYRYRVVRSEIAEEVDNCITTFYEQLHCEVMEHIVQPDHVHLLVMIPPKTAVANYVGSVKERTAIRVVNKFRLRGLHQKTIIANGIWSAY